MSRKKNVIEKKQVNVKLALETIEELKEEGKQLGLDIGPYISYIVTNRKNRIKIEKGEE